MDSSSSRFRASKYKTDRKAIQEWVNGKKSQIPEILRDVDDWLELMRNKEIEIRKASGANQGEIAEAMGTTQSAISKAMNKARKGIIPNSGPENGISEDHTQSPSSETDSLPSDTKGSITHTTVPSALFDSLPSETFESKEEREELEKDSRELEELMPELSKGDLKKRDEGLISNLS